MRWLLGGIGFALYAVVFLTVIGMVLVAITPIIIVQTFIEKWCARKQGRQVNWHIFKEGL